VSRALDFKIYSSLNNNLNVPESLYIESIRSKTQRRKIDLPMSEENFGRSEICSNAWESRLLKQKENLTVRHSQRTKTSGTPVAPQSSKDQMVNFLFHLIDIRCMTRINHPNSRWLEFLSSHQRKPLSSQCSLSSDVYSLCATKPRYQFHLEPGNISI
jgi:hypothetical protein